MSIFTKLFGNDNVVSKAADGIYDGIDKAVYTEEEKIDNRKAFLRLYEPFKVAQRLLALVYSIPYMFAWTVTFIVSFFGIDTTYQRELLSGDICTINSYIVGFYFLGGVVNGVISHNAGKAGSKSNF